MKTAYTSRATNPSKKVAFALALFLFLVSPLAQRLAQCEDPDRGIRVWADDDGKNKYLSYLELVNLLNQNLKDAQQLNIYVDVCHSGALLKGASKLTMPYFVAVGNKDPDKCVSFGRSDEDQKPPGRLTISGGYSDSYFYSFADYVTKRLKNTDQIATAQSLFDSASSDVKADPSLKGQMPDSTSGNKADLNLALNGGAKSNHALIFDGNREDLYEEPGLELYRALANAKYGFKQKAGNSLQYYDQDSKEQDYEGTHIDGKGTLANFRIALQNLHNLIKNNPQKELVNIFFDSHGYQKAAAAPRQPGLDGVPKDGVLVMGRTTGCLVVLTGESFWHDLKVGILSNDEDLIRVNPATFVLDVSEAQMSQPVAIVVNDLPLGYFNLSSTSTGGELEVTLPDSIASELIAEADGAPSITFTFEVAPGDYFRVATEDDILLDPAYTEGDYGFGIATTVIGLGLQSQT
jgi:hypothetical protein